MRLLERELNGNIKFSEFVGKPVPTYAILSHTWDDEEVSYGEVEAGKGRDKAGWKKIEFCSKQANIEGVRFIWVDTCCIDKKNAVELSMAINSMFRWYQNAVRCYVYLPDVSIARKDVKNQTTWEESFRKSRWFTRGWTLQELIAPSCVDFYCLEGERIGSKVTLLTVLSEITGIPKAALQGDALTDFSIQERKSWAENRQTTIEEDAVYSLLGIYGVTVPLVYGEGRENATRRVEEEVHKLYKGVDFEQFAVGIDVLSHPPAAQFVGRKTELTQIHKTLHTDETRSIVVLHGLGGMGKTQLAITYALRHKEKYTAIFWLNANDSYSLQTSFQHVARQLLKYHPSIVQLSGLDLDNDIEKVVDAVKNWFDLPGNVRWLLVYDNYDNPKLPGTNQDSDVDVRRFLPRSDQGSIIITTRSSQVNLGERIHIRKLVDINESLEILSKTSGRADLFDNDEAKELVNELDGLPLAVSTAGAYLEHVTISFGTYIKHYRKSWLKLQEKSPLLDSYDRSLYTTWQITLERIKSQNEMSALLLKLWAYFDRNDLYFELVRHAVSESDIKLVDDELDFHEALTLLVNYGLVDLDKSPEKQSDGQCYSLHTCVHSWTISVLNKEWDKHLEEQALHCVAQEVPNRKIQKWWLSSARILPHAIRQLDVIARSELLTFESAWGCHKIAELRFDQGKLPEAEQLWERVLRCCEIAPEQKREEDFSMFKNDIMLGLSQIYLLTGKFAESEKLMIQVVRYCEKLRGPKHEATLSTTKDLAHIYIAQYKLTEAEVLLDCLLKDTEALGPGHKVTFDTLLFAGSLYERQNKLMKAQEMYTKALRGYETMFGTEHPFTLTAVSALAKIYELQGDYVKAEEMFTRVLRDREEMLGSTHQETLATYKLLGFMYIKMPDKADLAKKMFQRALHGYTEVFGSDNEETIKISYFLGYVHYQNDEFNKAKEILEETLRRDTKNFGWNKDITCKGAETLASIYQKQGEKLVEAEDFFLQAIQGFEKISESEPGDDDTPPHLILMNDVAIFYIEQGRLEEAKTMCERALRQYKELNDRGESTDRLDCLDTLGTIYLKLGNFSRAEDLSKKALQGYEEILGSEEMASDVGALEITFNLGTVYAESNRPTLAKPLFEQALAGFMAVEGESSEWCGKINEAIQRLPPPEPEAKAEKPVPAQPKKSRLPVLKRRH